MSKQLAEVALASLSPRRKQLLEGLGLRVILVASGYHENNDHAKSITDPGALALRHAIGKAHGADQSGPDVLIAADTLVEIHGEILGKPRDSQDAVRMLRCLSGREHRVYTGFFVLDRPTGRSISGVESTAVRFVELPDRQIASYVASGDPMDKAGAYGIQGRGGLLVDSITGDFYTVMGLPLTRIAAARELGYDV